MMERGHVRLVPCRWLYLNIRTCELHTRIGLAAARWGKARFRRFRQPGDPRPHRLLIHRRFPLYLPVYIYPAYLDQFPLVKLS